MKSRNKIVKLRSRLFTSILAAFVLTINCGAGAATHHTGSFVITIENNDSSSKQNVPITFGHPFIKGAIFTQNSLIANDYINESIPVQLDVKSRWQDGSYKHAVISLVVPELEANSATTIRFTPEETISPTDDVELTKANFKSLGLNPKIRITELGQSFEANVYDNIDSDRVSKWLAGPTVTEWIVPAPLITNSGVEHTHLTAYFHVKYYSNGSATIATILENTHAFYEEKTTTAAFTSSPRNITYDWQVLSNNVVIDSAESLEHYAYSRWRKNYSYLDAHSTELKPVDSKLNLRMDKGYIIQSRAVANYDVNGHPEEELLAMIQTELYESDLSPMGMAMIDAVFASGVEGSLDSPWSVAYLLSGDHRAYDAMISNGNAAGSIGIHFRDERAHSDRRGEILSIIDNPLATIRDDSRNIPYFDGDKADPDTAHQNSFAYMAYLLTGDYYFLEELFFWANRNLLALNPEVGARNGANGLIKNNSVRGQAWALRTLANAAFITPDSHVNKAYFETLLQNNIGWYVESYTETNSPYYNELGIITYGFNENTGIGYRGNTGSQGWMDNWFTSVVGRIYNMGYIEIKPLLDFKAKTPVAIMTDPVFCYIFASTYVLYVRDGAGQPLYDWKQVYEKTIENDYNGNDQYLDILNSECGSQRMAELINNSGAFSLSANGEQYDANEMLYTLNVSASYFGRLQGAVAAASDSGIVGGREAWQKLSDSSNKPNFNRYKSKTSTANGNKYNIVPLNETAVISGESGIGQCVSSIVYGG